MICIPEIALNFIPKVGKQKLEKGGKKKIRQTHGKKSSVLRGHCSFAAFFASVYMDGVEYRALTRPS